MHQIEQMALLVQAARAIKFVAVVLVVAYFAIALVGKITKPDGINYVCHGDLIANTATNTYECKPRSKP
jgi:hypothetical protein